MITLKRIILVLIFLPLNVFAIGALVQDSEFNRFGVSANQPDEKTALKMAMYNCEKRGNTGCKLVSYFTNSCAAVYISGSEEKPDAYGYTVAGKSWDDAGNIAEGNCKKAGGISCEKYRLASQCENVMFKQAQESLIDKENPKISINGMVFNLNPKNLPVCSEQPFNNCFGIIRHFAGEFHNGYLNGFGKKGFCDPSSLQSCQLYIGEFKNDLENGHGIEFKNNLKRFEGEFVNGKRFGNGVIYSADGSIKKSCFFNDMNCENPSNTSNQSEIRTGSISQPEPRKNTQPQNNTPMNILLTMKTREGIVYMYDGHCEYENLSSIYPLKFEGFKEGTTQSLGTGCYSFIKSTRQVLFANQNGSVVTVSIDDIQNSNKSWWQKFSEGIERANQYNQQMQANRPPAVHSTPGIVGGNTQPIDLGGKFNMPIPISQPKNCTSVVYGNQINTSCY